MRATCASNGSWPAEVFAASPLACSPRDPWSAEPGRMSSPGPIPGSPSARPDPLARRRPPGRRSRRGHLASAAAGSPARVGPGWLGLRHHLVQRRGESQPRWITSSGRAVLRFDGRDDDLERPGMDLKLDAVSVFLVAARPRTSAAFRGLLAGNQAGVNDYTSGFTIDLGPSPRHRLDFLNVEGKGFGGAANLLKEPRPFGQFHLFEVIIPQAAGRFPASWTTAPRPTRPRKPADHEDRRDDLGARCYSNEPRPGLRPGILPR